MSSGAEHSFIEAIAAAVALRIPKQEPLQIQLDELGIEPMRAYSATEVAEILGTKRVDSIYEIPETELPRVRRIGSSVGYLGINVLLYMHRLPPVDMQAVLESYREALLRSRPAVRALHPDQQERTRVL